MSVKIEGPFQITPVNIYEIKTKKIVFTGSQRDAARFLNCGESNISWALRFKTKVNKKKYAIRYAKQ